MLYQLDGVFFDDEYSKYSGAPGFEPSPSSEAAARLCYETRKQLVIKSFRFMSTAELLRFLLLMAFNRVTL